MIYLAKLPGAFLDKAGRADNVLGRIVKGRVKVGFAEAISMDDRRRGSSIFMLKPAQSM